jgi:hypothetical protein
MLRDELSTTKRHQNDNNNNSVCCFGRARACGGTVAPPARAPFLLESYTRVDFSRPPSFPFFRLPIPHTFPYRTRDPPLLHSLDAPPPLHFTTDATRGKTKNNVAATARTVAAQRPQEKRTPPPNRNPSHSYPDLDMMCKVIYLVLVLVWMIVRGGGGGGVFYFRFRGKRRGGARDAAPATARSPHLLGTRPKIRSAHPPLRLA